jgi:Flp pilus assembly protein TadD
MKKKPFPVFLIAIVGLIAYSNTFDVPFQFDDHWNIAENQLIRDLGNFISSAKGYDYNPRRYVGYLSFALNYHIGGLEVTGYHIVNLAIHVLNSILVYFLVVLTFRTPYFSHQPSAISSQQSAVSCENNSRFTIHGSRFVALFSALLFVVHPVQTQAVTYIVQRFTSLATLFYLLSVVMYIKGRLITEKARGDRREAMGRKHDTDEEPSPLASGLWPIAWFSLALLSAVLAMKTKEITFTLPLVVLLYEFSFFRSSLRKKLLFLIPVLLTLAIIPLSTMGVNRPLGEILSDLSEQTRIQTGISRGDYLMTEMRVIVTYIRLIFLPVNQNLDYDYPVSHSFLAPSVFLSCLFLSALFAAALYLLYRTRQEARGNGQGEESKEQEVVSPIANRFSPIACYRLVAFGILWFFITLSVESSLIPIADVIFEHRVYLPSAGAFIALAATLCAAAAKAEDIWAPGARVFIPFALIIMALSGATFARNTVWKDSLTLWEDVVGKSPANARAHNNLGFIYHARGMTDQAIEQCVSAVRLRPGYLDARINLGIAYNAKGRADEALEQFIIALSMNPDDADAHNNIGIVYVSKGRIDEGIRHYQTALRFKPDYPEAYNNLGVAYAVRGRFDQAATYFRYALQLNPGYFEASHNLALAYEIMGRQD